MKYNLTVVWVYRNKTPETVAKGGTDIHTDVGMCIIEGPTGDSDQQVHDFHKVVKLAMKEMVDGFENTFFTENSNVIVSVTPMLVPLP